LRGCDIFLDVSRLIGRSWTGKLPTGIDRVCYAYVRHYKNNARAVVQHRGVKRILSKRYSAKLFELLLGADSEFRAALILLIGPALATSKVSEDCKDAFYLNLGHTDFHLDGLSGWVRRCRLRPIYMIHDLIPLTHSEFCSARAVNRHRARVHNALDHAAGIIANSQSTADELRRYAAEHGYRLPPIKASWLAGAKFLPPSSAIARSKPHFVYVSTIEGRKNHFMLLQIWRRLVDTLGSAAPDLLIIGQKGAQADHAISMIEQGVSLQNHVITLSRCADEEMGYWIKTARALVFPSFAEGFGLPVVESLELGTPVIASDLACFREIGQGIPTLIDPIDAIAWEQMILAFMHDCPERQRQLDMLKHFRPMTWDMHFLRIDGWLTMLSQQRRPLAIASTNVSNAHLPDRTRSTARIGYRHQAAQLEMDGLPAESLN
jgi:glycosyltransferase involved in cell wall biosynthesis